MVEFLSWLNAWGTLIVAGLAVAVSLGLGIPALVRAGSAERRADRLEERERERDQRDIERLTIERKALELQQTTHDAEETFRKATTVEQRTTAAASAQTALQIEQQELAADRARKEVWLETARDFGDEPRTKILESELEINRLRTRAIERDMVSLGREVAALRDSIPNEDQRKREALRAINDELRRHMF